LQPTLRSYTSSLNEAISSPGQHSKLCITVTRVEGTGTVEVFAGQRPSLPITGERTVPGILHENYWFRRHEAVYVEIAADLDDAVVLEAGCGEGYGAQLLADRARRVVALDYDGPTIAHCGRAYSGLLAVGGNLVALPFAEGTFDAVVSLQTVEHLWDQDAFVAECRRILAPTGRLILSTPNRLTFPPGNPFHATEFSPSELRALVERHGHLASLRGVGHGPALLDWESHHGSIVDAQLATSPDRWPTALAERVATVGLGDFVITGDELETSLDLLAVVSFA
jgi:SAM-dependent methyltransferase